MCVSSGRRRELITAKVKTVPEDNRSWLDRLLRRSNNDIPVDIDPCDDPSLRSEVDCGDVRANASDYIDGESSQSLTHRIKDHLGLCKDCNGWMRSLAATVGFTRDLPKEEVPDSLKEKIRNITSGS